MSVTMRSRRLWEGLRRRFYVDGTPRRSWISNTLVPVIDVEPYVRVEKNFYDSFTLVNNAVYSGEHFTCPSGVIRFLKYGALYNADDVDRVARLLLRKSRPTGTVVHAGFILDRVTITAETSQGFPVSGVDCLTWDAGGNGIRMDEGDELRVWFAAGGASAGGTGDLICVYDEVNA